MIAKKRPTRYSHTEGHTSICYSDDGKYILTCGIDGDVRIWEGLEDDDPSSQCVGEQALSVVHKGDHYYVGTDNNYVQAYTFPGSDRDGIISRFTAPVTHIDISADGKRIVAGSSDMEIHITDLETSKSSVLAGHKAPVLGVALDPKNEFVVSSSCDGTVRVWSIERKETVKTWDCVPKCNDFFAAKCLGRSSWVPGTGRYLAVPHGKEVHVFERVEWTKKTVLSQSETKQDFSITAFSPCGFYIAACSIGGDICVWDVNGQTCVTYIKHERGISGMAWNPAGNGEIAFCDVMGQLGTIENCLPSSKDASKSDTSTAAEESNKTTDEEKTMTVEEMIQLNGFDDDDDDDNENSFSIGKIKAELSQQFDDADKVTNDDLDDDRESKMSVITKVVPQCDLQPPFQPSSTPVHLQHRFMVWNSVGIVKCYNTEAERSIDVEFHDSSLHHALHINNYLKHTMATLTEEVLVLACESQDDAPSKMVCVLLNSWDGSKEWSVELPEEEEALAVAAALGWVAVATDTRNLRVFTVGGSQREVVSLPGPVVCVAGHKNRLLAVYHNGIGLPGDQSLGFAIFAVGSGILQALTTFQPLAMSPKSTLKWAGFSDEGTPFIMDSAGIVRMFSRKGYWLPVCDTQSQCKNKSDHYFLIGISEKYQNIRCVPCKGSYYPPTTPRPTVTEISLQLPLCESTSDKTVLEEKFWRSQIISSTIEELCKTEAEFSKEKDDLDRTIKETVIKLFAWTCRNGTESNAVELCNLMPSHQVAQLAMKYASKLGRMHLADKVAEVVTRKLDEEEQGYKNSYEDYSIRSTWEKSEVPPLYSRRNSQEEDYSDDYNRSQRDSQTSENGEKESSDAKETESLLLLAKQRRSESILGARTDSQPSQKRLNPFKKTSNKFESGKAFENLSASYTKLQQMKNRKSVSVEQSPVPQTKAKQTKLSISKSTTSKKEPTFMEWYAKEKDGLREEFPDLSDSDLSRQGMKRYKESKSKLVVVEDSISVDSMDTQSTEASLPDSPVSDTKENKEPDPQSSNSETPVPENKKRKLDQLSSSEAEKPVKKTPVSSSSKLKAFLFKKS